MEPYGAPQTMDYTEADVHDVPLTSKVNTSRKTQQFTDYSLHVNVYGSAFSKAVFREKSEESAQVTREPEPFRTASQFSHQCEIKTSFSDTHIHRHTSTRALPRASPLGDSRVSWL